MNKVPSELVAELARSLLNKLPPEGQFVAACISMPATDESRVRGLGFATPALNWARVVSEAASHCVIAPLYAFVTKQCVDCIPEDILADLRRRNAVNAIAQLRLLHELIAIREALSSFGLQMLALKGPALALQAYGDLAARESGDLDILIRPNDLSEVARALSERGYCSRRYEFGALDSGFFCSFEDQFQKQGGPLIDLHLRLLPRYFPLQSNREAVWRRALAIDFDGKNLLTLSPLDHLIFSIAHATKHGWAWASLRAMRDIAALTASPLADWEQAEREMEMLGCSRMLHLGALLAYTFAGARVPASVLDRAASDSHSVRIAHGVARRLFPASGLVPPLYSDWVVPLTAIEGWPKRCRYLIDRALRPTIEDWEALPLPRALYALYYITRPVRLLLRHGLRLIQDQMEPAHQ